MNIQIVTKYQTSKGIFHSMETAMKNRAKIIDGDRFNPQNMRENVKVISVLTDGNDNYFMLQPIDYPK